MTHLAVVPQSGEIPMDCPGCAELQVQYAGAENEVRRLRRLLADARRDRQGSAETHERWEEGTEVFAYWQRKCGHPNTRFDYKRFELLLPYLDDPGPRQCCVAILGASYDPFTTTLRNGKVKRHDSWELIFRDRGKLEDFIERAPK